MLAWGAKLKYIYINLLKDLTYKIGAAPKNVQ
jgi:hypothetical protein